MQKDHKTETFRERQSAVSGLPRNVAISRTPRSGGAGGLLATKVLAHTVEPRSHRAGSSFDVAVLGQLKHPKLVNMQFQKRGPAAAVQANEYRYGELRRSSPDWGGSSEGPS